MTKKKTNDLMSLTVVLVLLYHYYGLEKTICMMKEILIWVNNIMIYFLDTTILNSLFKYCITFPIVGIILVKLGYPKGATGKYIGKILYFAIGYFVGMILDLLTNWILMIM